MAFKPASVPPTPCHETIGREIVAKCKGVPLAIKVIGGIMYFKEDKIEWELLRSKELAMIDPRKNNITRTLKVGYDLLPLRLKYCFAYCRLFPKDHVINVDKLVALWMAQGYIDPSQCLEDIGRDCFMDLLRMSFFQDVEKDEYGNIVSCKIHDLMHDLASSVAGDESVYVSISNPREVNEKTRHISFDRRLNLNNDIWQSVLEAKSLRTFLAPDGYGGDIGEGQCHAIFRNLRRLRQLDLQECGIETVPNSIRKMKQLRYLDLSCNSEIKMLPCSITGLQNLQVLNLKCCKGLRQLPKNIKELVSLKRLDIRDCDALTHMPRGIGQLTSLERLTRFVLPKSEKEECENGGLGELCIDIFPGSQNKESKSGGLRELHGLELGGASGAETCAAANANLREKPRLERLAIIVRDVLTHSLDGIEPLTSFKLQESESGGLEELQDLNKLGGYLRIENLPHQKGGTTPTAPETCAAAKANLREKPRLQQLELHWLPLEDVDINEDEMSLKALRPHQNLKRLKVENYGGINFASWLSSLTNLVRLDLYSCRKCQSLPALDQFLSLKEIQIWGLYDLQDIDMSSCCAGGGRSATSGSGSNNSMVSFFPSLEKLELCDCPKLKGWRPSSSSGLLPQFQCLSQLFIRFCPDLTSMPPVSPSLKKLQVSSVSIELLEQMLKGTIPPAHEPSSSSLPSSLSSSLKHLQIDNIDLPEDFLPVQLLQTLTSLQQLRILRCPTLTSLPHAKMLLLTSLKYLEILQCENLDLSYDDDGNSNNNDAIPWQGQGLKTLVIEDIPKLVNLPRRLLLHSIALRNLLIFNCPNVASLPDWMPNLTSLQYLEIKNCSKLSCNGENWPNIAYIPTIILNERTIRL